jgi:glycosyltransferase involved in cell wall biosynthesis
MVKSLLKFYQKLHALFKCKKFIDEIRSDLDKLKSKLDTPPELFDSFYSNRNEPEYLSVFSKDKPLVTVCICTYNRGKLLTERSIPSILDQTYKNIELLVIGDCCTDDTAQLVNDICDPRLHFINLPERGRYPENPVHRWRVAGTVPVNHALALARGDFITHLDDDDEFVVDRIEKLVKFIQEEKADLVWHPYWNEQPNGSWVLNKAQEFVCNKVTTSSIFYHRWFTAIPWDIEAYRYHEPGDWNRLRKFKYLGAQVARYPEPLLKHYCERNQKSS